MTQFQMRKGHLEQLAAQFTQKLRTAQDWQTLVEAMAFMNQNITNELCSVLLAMESRHRETGATQQTPPKADTPIQGTRRLWRFRDYQMVAGCREDGLYLEIHAKGLLDGNQKEEYYDASVTEIYTALARKGIEVPPTLRDDLADDRTRTEPFQHDYGDLSY